MNDAIRKQDTREKIRLGGLIVKAGLRQADVAFILGCLIKASKLDVESSEYKEFTALGKKEFAKARD